VLHLDTSTIIEILRFRKNALLHFELTSTADMRVSSIVVAELWSGAHAAGANSYKTARLQELLSFLEVVPFNNSAAQIAGQIRVELAKKGAEIGSFDVLIAAAAIDDGATLVSCDTKHFRRVKDLAVIDWSKP